MCPLASRPGKTFEHILTEDRDLPIEDQAVFLIRFLSGEDWSKVAKVSEELDIGGAGTELLPKIVNAIHSGLAGWKNFKHETGNLVDYESVDVQATLNRYFALSELMELLAVIVNQMPTPEDKKKLDSQSDSKPESVVSDAEVPENAKTE